MHTLAVMVVGAIPGAGAFAYGVSAPLRRNLVLVQLLSDELGSKLPFKLHKRLGLQKLVTLGRRSKVDKAGEGRSVSQPEGDSIAA